MTQFYDILETIKNELRASPFINTVTFGDIGEVDLDKTSMFPLSHIIMENVQYKGNILIFNVKILFTDVVDYNNEESEFDRFYGNDNLQDVFNTQLQAANNLITKLKRGDLFANRYQLDNEPTLEPFKERFANELAGWSTDISISMPNNTSIC